MHSCGQHFDQSQSVSWGKLTDVKILPAALAKGGVAGVDSPKRWRPPTIDKLLPNVRPDHENADLFPLAAVERVNTRATRLHQPSRAEYRCFHLEHDRLGKAVLLGR